MYILIIMVIVIIAVVGSHLSDYIDVLTHNLRPGDQYYPAICLSVNDFSTNKHRNAFKGSADP